MLNAVRDTLHLMSVMDDCKISHVFREANWLTTHARANKLSSLWRNFYPPDLDLFIRIEANGIVSYQFHQ